MNWIRVSQLSDELGLSAQAVRDLIRAGKLNGTKDPEGRWLIEADSARAYAAAHAPAKTSASEIKRIEEKLDRLVVVPSHVRQLT
jgi:predicted site-specific integrase-resolvase